MKCLGERILHIINYKDRTANVQMFHTKYLCLRIGGGQDLLLVERFSRADVPANHSPVYRAGRATASLSITVC